MNQPSGVIFHRTNVELGLAVIRLSQDQYKETFFCIVGNKFQKSPTKTNQDLSSSPRHCNSGILVENPLYINLEGVFRLNPGLGYRASSNRTQVSNVIIRECKHRRFLFTDVNRKSLFRYCDPCACVVVFDTEVTDVRKLITLGSERVN